MTPILYNSTITLKRRSATYTRGRLVGESTVDVGPFSASVQVDKGHRVQEVATSGKRQREHLKAYVQSTGARSSEQYTDALADNVTISIYPGETYRVMSVEEYAADLAGHVTMTHELLRLVRIDEGGKEVT